MISAASVRREGLLRHVEHMKERLDAIAKRRRVPDPLQTSEALQDLFTCFKTRLISYGGSNEERSEARTRLFSMQLALEQPTLFFLRCPQALVGRTGCRIWLERWKMIC
ncbi:hypothetical protein JG687_00012327 [Phytophthora cactorum]|uniref:Uncharacterized protein n=1 Tax=Phytophthora cactorum TaxID=29920 RepID=A0A8T1U467_9STRA|nr:hypothetical protein JG687_00012327 [Phytophthora cactorum]